MKFIKDFLGMTAVVAVGSLALFYVWLVGVSFIVWELPNFYWSWVVFRVTGLFGMSIGVWFAIDQVVDDSEKEGTE